MELHSGAGNRLGRSRTQSTAGRRAVMTESDDMRPAPDYPDFDQLIAEFDAVVAAHHAALAVTRDAACATCTAAYDATCVTCTDTCTAANADFVTTLDAGRAERPDFQNFDQLMAELEAAYAERKPFQGRTFE